MQSPYQTMRLEVQDHKDPELALAANATERHELIPRSEKSLELASLQSLERHCSFQKTLSLPRSRSDAQGTLSLEEGPVGSLPKDLDLAEPGAEGGELSMSKSGQILPTSYICGVDARRGPPAAFICLVMMGWLYNKFLQPQLLEDMAGFGKALTMSTCCSLAYALASICMAFAGLCDPGCLSPELSERWRAGLRLLPRRAHKNFLYERPVLRFDHYCRWLMNCIGLRNHREFMVLILLLASLAVIGAAGDIVVVCFGLQRVWLAPRQLKAMLGLHLAVSLIFAYLVVPICRLHAGLISRNELAYEWKWEDFQVIVDSATGEPIKVAGLAQEEYDARRAKGTIQYDPSLNTFDKGCKSNCWAFWCTSRWARTQLGEF